MKGFLSFVRKEFRHIFRDKRTILIVLVMPVVQIILFGFAISTEVYDARVDIVGNWSDPSVRRIAGRIEQNHYLRVVSVYETVADVPERFRKGLTDVAVCFERDFDARLRHEGRAEVRLLSDASDPNTAQYGPDDCELCQRGAYGCPKRSAAEGPAGTGKRGIIPLCTIYV